jgi:hypothetical protein
MPLVDQNAEPENIFIMRKLSESGSKYDQYILFDFYFFSYPLRKKVGQNF